MTTTNHSGLSAEEILESRRLNGANTITPPKRDPWYVLYFEKFKDPIIRILVIAAAVALVVGFHEGNFIEGIGIIAAIFLSTGLSFVNEYRAAQEFDILNQVSDDEPVPVIRGGRHRTAPKRDLVVGDIVIIEASPANPNRCGKTAEPKTSPASPSPGTSRRAAAPSRTGTD